MADNELFGNSEQLDTISRKWLMECLNAGGFHFDTERDENIFIHLVRDTAPPVQSERKKGKWIVNIFDYKSVCSVCGADETEFIHGTEMWYGLGKSKFCPNCGADMRGESDGCFNQQTVAHGMRR